MQLISRLPNRDDLPCGSAREIGPAQEQPRAFRPGTWEIVGKKYSLGAHTTHLLRYHLVWAPKYRKPILIGRVAARLREIFNETAFANRWVIKEMNVQCDHVHMMIELVPAVSVARAVQLLKGTSSFRLRGEFPGLKGVGSFWATGYFAESVGSVEAEVIQRYIRAQPEEDQSLPQGGSRGL